MHRFKTLNGIILGYAYSLITSKISRDTHPPLFGKYKISLESKHYMLIISLKNLLVLHYVSHNH
ncbi:hypothetical protein HanHA300_Chr16g0613411 [Helianthus annuus]|nr:hypothetical protein HanHA300_Chr16g0613411 [Helianthus annuus]KAJ0460710.1 hypothetical protein HanHA89_Chr16g0664001 [Helianthus annuus]